MTSKLLEIAFVVDDIGSAIEKWTTTLGVGPFYGGIFDVPDQFYRGRPASCRLDVAFGFSNGVLIELIKPLDEAPNIFSEAGIGFHHLLFETHDRETETARYRSQGFEVVQSCESGPTPFAMIDTRAAIGAFIEIMDFGCFSRLYALMASASEDWDGSEPRRDLFAALAA